jgi:hopanoid biosynthesis associated radical SAM protein HpnH
MASKDLPGFETPSAPDLLGLDRLRDTARRRKAELRGGALRRRKARTPGHIARSILRLQIENRWAGKKRFPFVLMLEPLYVCNLACRGCSVERHTGKLDARMPLSKALGAVDESKAPIVSICGGEPTIYPELPELVRGIITRKRHIYLCTNGLLLAEKVFDRIAPNERLTLNLHLDGLEATHDHVCRRDGVFAKAIEGLKAAKARGYHVTTNTTVFRETRVEEIEGLCERLTDLGVDGILVAPGYEYPSAEEDIFLDREEMHRKFERILALSERFPLTSTPLFLEFAAGRREYPCSPWSTVTYTPKGWKGPCYLVGERFHATWSEFWNGEDWAYWESRQDPACQNCKMHTGFEASAVMESFERPRDLLRMTRWQLWG